MTLSENEIVLLTRQFHAQFLDWADPVPEEGAGEESAGAEAGHRRPGPVPAAEGSLGLRHLADPVARVLAGLYFARVFPMETLYARNADERDALSKALRHITGVEPLLRDGRLLGCVVTWTGERWPKRPTGMRVSLPGGEAERRRLLGRFEPHLRRMAAALAAPHYRHYVGDKEIGPPRR